MKQKLSRTKVFGFALAVGASLTVMATSAAPAFADSGPSVHNGARTDYCTACDQDPGDWGVSDGIGSGRGEVERHPPVRHH
jgi:hypothetical protein